ncbi:MAG: PilZ domain-containing protein [Minwuia sp.]|nr:PilZ domain-containing protein [Minwuia sp.]
MSTLQVVRRRLSQIHMLFAPPPELRRAHRRFTVNLPIKVRELEEGGAESRIAVDVSDGGLFFEPALGVPTGTLVEVSVGLFLRNARATIVSHRANGTAVLFESPAHGAAIRAWLTEIAESGPQIQNAGLKTILSEPTAPEEAPLR